MDHSIRCCVILDHFLFIMIAPVLFAVNPIPVLVDVFEVG